MWGLDYQVLVRISYCMTHCGRSKGMTEGRSRERTGFVGIEIGGREAREDGAGVRGLGNCYVQTSLSVGNPPFPA